MLTRAIDVLENEKKRRRWNKRTGEKLKRKMIGEKLRKRKLKRKKVKVMAKKQDSRTKRRSMLASNSYTDREVQKNLRVIGY